MSELHPDVEMHLAGLAIAMDIAAEAEEELFKAVIGEGPWTGRAIIGWNVGLLNQFRKDEDG